MFANKVCKQFEGAIILKHYPVLMPYSVLIAQIENPITASWQCSQLYNFTALCFLCGATWRDRYFTMNCQTRSLSYRYSNKASISLESAQTYYQVCLFFPLMWRTGLGNSLVCTWQLPKHKQWTVNDCMSSCGRGGQCSRSRPSSSWSHWAWFEIVAKVDAWTPFGHLDVIPVYSNTLH